MMDWPHENDLGLSASVTPAKAGVHCSGGREGHAAPIRGDEQWIPAFAGMTGRVMASDIGQVRQATT
jgi:hypothetical protein